MFIHSLKNSTTLKFLYFTFGNCMYNLTLVVISQSIDFKWHSVQVIPKKQNPYFIICVRKLFFRISALKLHLNRICSPCIACLITFNGYWAKNKQLKETQLKHRAIRETFFFIFIFKYFTLLLKPGKI